MASTGLLGINPYRKGNVAVDFLSRPIQLAIQLQQKEQAKAEALEKYFMDYEKSINPKGLGKGEGDVFTNKYNQIRQYWMQNKDAILHPAKYGYDAQSTYMAGLKDALNYIDQAKQATAERKAFVDYINKQKAAGKHISDNYLEIANNAMKPVGAGYIAPDFSQIQIYDPHNEKQFTANVWGGIDLPKREVFVDEVIGNKKTGKVIKQTYQDINNDVIKNVSLGAANEYRSNRGTREHFNELFQDKAFTSQINNVFKKRFDRDIKDAEDLAIGYALTQKPGGLIKSEAPEYSWMSKFNMTQGAINARANKDAENMIDPVDQYIADAKSGKTFAGAEGENIEMVNFPETILKDLGQNKRPATIGRGIGDGEFYNIVYQKEIDTKTGKETGKTTDLIDWSKTQKIPQSQIRAAVVKHALPSGAKVKLISPSGGKSSPKFVGQRKFN